MYILYLNTGIWDSFFASQREWGHHLQLPKFPFRSWRRETLWEDLIAITLSAGFGITSVILFVKHFVKKSPVLVEPHVLFSLLYLTGVGLFVFIFGGGDFHSLNRYVFCTPFFWIVCLNFTSLKIKVPILFWLGIVLTLLIILSSNGIFIENVDLGKTAVYSLIIGLFMQRWIYWTLEKKYKIYTIALIIIGFAFQIHLFHTYLSGKWIG